MKRFRNPGFTLIVLFAALLVLVPVIQTGRELISDESDGLGAFQIFSQAPTAANLRNFENSLEEASWATTLSRPWLQFAQFKWLKDGGEKVVMGHSGWFFYKPGLSFTLARQELTDGARATNDPVAAIVHFRDQLAAQGIRLLLMPVPNKESIYPDLLSSRAQEMRGVKSPYTQDVLNRLESHGVEMVDLFNEFGKAREEEKSGEEALYLAQDTHWSPMGVSLAAKAAARRLVELGWVQRGQTEYSEKPAPVQRLGDLVQMLQSPLIARETAPEKVAAVQVVRGPENKPYSDGAEAEVLVLGDSFMRIYQTDAPTAAGFIAHLAKELKQPLMSLVNDGGGATLVREELVGRYMILEKKKVVLWEFVERDLGLALRGWQRIVLPHLQAGGGAANSGSNESANP